MAEGILLEAARRDRLAPEPERVARLAAAIPQIEIACAGETDAVALEATLACLLWLALPQTNWCGFYRRVGASTLAVGPYQGSMGCLRIDFARGVCGAAARTGVSILVPDVNAFPGHIACDDASRSELVVPVFDIRSRRLAAVLDLDSPFVAGFGERECEMLEGVLGRVFGADVTF